MTDTRTLKRMFNQAAEWYPENVAFVDGLEDRRVTYAEANETSRRIANGLADRGVERGDRVAMLADPCIDHVQTFYAVHKLGAISSTLHVRESRNALVDMARHIDATALVFDSTYADTAEYIDERVESVECCVEYGNDGDASSFATSMTTLVDESEATEPDVDVTPDEPAFINFTSGSTGKPKGIVHTHEEAVEAARDGQYMIGPDDSDSSLIPSTPSFIAWKIHVLPITNVGGRLVFMSTFDPEKVPEVIETERVSIVFLVPTQWKMVAQAGFEDHDLSSVRLAGFGGEPLSSELFRKIQEQVTENFTSTYGTTETILSGLALRPHRVEESTLESVGRPVPNVDVRIIDPNQKDPSAEVPDGEVGELIVRGPAVAEEVWENPEKTEEIFHEDGWWFSGDLAARHEDGNVYLKGRKDNMIITGGINVYAEAVEGIVETHPAVVECAIIGVPHDKWGESLKAFVVSSDEGLSADEMEDWCKDNDDLADYQRPRSWEFVDELPRTNTGKLERATLRESEE